MALACGAGTRQKVEKAFLIFRSQSNGQACPPCRPNHYNPEILGFKGCFGHLEEFPLIATGPESRGSSTPCQNLVH